METIPEIAFDPHYCFSLDAELESSPFGAIPGGFGIDLIFREGGTVSSQEAHDRADNDEQTRWGKLRGKVLSGHDWFVVTEAGLAQFDSRFVLSIPAGSLSDNEGEIMVGGQLRGRVSLDDVVSPAGAPPARDSYRRWKVGFGGQATLPLLLSLTFDVSAATVATLSADRSKDLAKYAALERGLFVGAGVARFREGPYSPIDAISLRVYELRAKVRS